MAEPSVARSSNGPNPGATRPGDTTTNLDSIVVQESMLSRVPCTKAVTSVCNVALQLENVKIIVQVAGASPYVQAMIIASVIAIEADRKARCRRRPSCTSYTEHQEHQMIKRHETRKF